MPQSNFLGEFEHVVLLALMRLGDDAYGTTIRREIEANTGRSVSCPLYGPGTARPAWLCRQANRRAVTRTWRPGAALLPAQSGRSIGVGTVAVDAAADVERLRARREEGMRPPRFAERLLAWSVPDDDRVFMLGDCECDKELGGS